MPIPFIVSDLRRVQNGGVILKRIVALICDRQSIGIDCLNNVIMSIISSQVTLSVPLCVHPAPGTENYLTTSNAC